MIIYIDIYFIINFFADYLSLVITARILKRRLPFLVPLISSGICSVIATAGILLQLPYILQLLINLVAFIVNNGIVFKYHSFKDFIVNMSILFSVGVAIAGATETIETISIMVTPRSSFIKLTIFIVFALLTNIALHKILAIPFTPATCEVQIRLHDKVTKFHALIDTGSFLREPITQRPILLISNEILSELERSTEALLKTENGNTAPLSCVQISSKGIGGKTTLRVFECNEVKIKVGRHTFLSDALIGYSPELTGKFSNCDALIPNAAISLNNI